MQLLKSLEWADPLTFARPYIAAHNPCVFLYSGQDVGYSGRYSILAIDMQQEIKGDDFAAFSACLEADSGRFDNAWFGYLGYGLKQCLESLPADKKGALDLPDLWMMRFATLIVFDHDQHCITVWSENEDFEILSNAKAQTYPEIEINSLSSNMTKAEYITKVNHLKEAISSGEVYETNLTRKFSGKLNEHTDSYRIFESLCAISPAVYSSFIRIEQQNIISSSPEQFLDIAADGHIQTRPIKGSARRYDDAKKDEGSRHNLKHSQKDKAENLMIVDLMRNDLSRTSTIGSVKVERLFEVTSYPTVHHMFSTITAQKSADSTTIDVIKQAFPPGSMTGAPKIKAMELCSALEILERGVYSGAIGWFGGDGSADLSVVIRTIISDGKNFEFQVGGAIVSDSDAISEWQETLTKARAIMQCLNINQALIESL